MDSKNIENPLRKEKQNKLQKLRELGVDPYPHNYKKLHTISEAIKKENHIKAGESSSKIYKLAGRIMLKRDMGKAAFLIFGMREGISSATSEKMTLKRYLCQKTEKTLVI